MSHTVPHGCYWQSQTQYSFRQIAITKLYEMQQTKNMNIDLEQ